MTAQWISGALIKLLGNLEMEKPEANLAWENTANNSLLLHSNEVGSSEIFFFLYNLCIE